MEMKRDKKWLKNQIEIMGTETSENYPHEQMVDREVVLKLVDQLDGPMVSNKTLSDLLEANKSLTKRVKELEPEIPTVPSYVDEFIKETGEGTTVMGLMKRALSDEGSDLAAWLVKNETYREDVQNQKDFVLAYFGGKYKVEKEPLYYIPLGVKRAGQSPVYLFKTLEGVDIDWSPSRHIEDEKYAYAYRFTESEIKEINPNYWPFAEPVEDSP